MKPITIFLAALMLSVAATPAAAQSGQNVIHDDFSDGAITWNLGADWTVQSPSAETNVLTGNTQSDRFAWKTNITLASSWVAETEASLNQLFNDGNHTGTIGFALGGPTNLLVLADVIYSRDGFVYPGLGFWTGAWNDGLANHPWTDGATNKLKLRLERPLGRSNLVFTISSPTGLQLRYVSKDIPGSIWSNVQHVGFRAFKVNASFSYLSIETPLEPTVDIAMYPGITIRGEPGSTYRIEYTTPITPAQWTTATNVVLITSTAIWFDLNWTNRQQRFYRAVQVP